VNEQDVRGGGLPQEYALKGPQAEPPASYWLQCPAPRVLSLQEITSVTDNPNHSGYFPPYLKAVRPGCSGDIADDIDELQMLAGLRDDPNAVASNIQCRERLPISMFLQLRPQPLSAVVRPGRLGDPMVATPRELARYFENETPALAHRHALNYLLDLANWSPPRQSLVWAALDVTVHSALLAAWYYKWLSQRPNTSFRPRPIEVAPDLNILYDREVAYENGEIVDGAEQECPQCSPGTPRHPSYPAGHSTYGGAASELLTYFFPEFREEFDRLADNTGMARLWAGIHYRTDHVGGLQLGRTIARLVIDQIIATGIVRCPPRTPCAEARDKEPPTQTKLEAEAEKFAADCGKGQQQPECPGTNPDDPQLLRRTQSLQQGAY